MKDKIAVIIGAGPAGLTAAYELLDKTDIQPIVFEMTPFIGGISRTTYYKGNRLDIGGHRFFSKSDRVMNWWKNFLPVQGAPARDDIILNRELNFSSKKTAPDPEKHDLVMLIRSRISRIYFLRSFFDYPISLKWKTFKNLGIVRIIKIGLSYTKVRLFPIKNEKSLEDFFINRFGKELYITFFKDYTEKVWGVPCNKIRPEWGAQRIKGLSITKTVLHAIKSIISKDTSIGQKSTETSLIEQFLYPKFGPGQLWEEVANQIKKLGGKIHLNHEAVSIKTRKNKVIKVSIKNNNTSEISEYDCDYIFSTMPVKDLVHNMLPQAPKDVRTIADGLVYRDFIAVGVLVKNLEIKNNTTIKTINNLVPDHWIYIQERDVKLGRLQIFNNWSPYMLQDPNNIWLGLEYFCNEGDELWEKNDEDFAVFAIKELAKINIINKDNVIDSTVVRMKKTYPAYFGTYDKFNIVQDHLDKIENLFLIGRNGMHRYNNSDHSMLTAMTAVENIVHGIKTKENIWDVNTEKEYHEEK